jgi:hypothetical protein
MLISLYEAMRRHVETVTTKMLQNLIQEVLGSNFGLDIPCPGRVFRNIPQPLLANAGILLLLPSKFFPFIIPVILPVNGIYCIC